MRQESEPSVEEILASIKQVIARDSRESAAELRRSRTVQPAMPENSDNAPSNGAAEDAVLDLGTGHYLDEEAAAEEGSEEGEEGGGDAPLLNKAVSHTMRDSLEALAMLAQPGARPQIVRSGETSLEGLVREMLRPLLAAWLEENLPGMVERLVADEIARIAGKRG